MFNISGNILGLILVGAIFLQIFYQEGNMWLGLILPIISFPYQLLVFKFNFVACH